MKMHKATDRVIRILELLAKKTSGLTLNEIVDGIDEPRTSVYEILNTLKSKNIIEYDENKKYTIGVRTFQIGSSYTRKNNLIVVAKRPMEELADKIGKTTILAVLDNMRVTHIHKHEPYGQIIVTTSIGTRAEIHSTAFGKVLLAYEKSENVDEVLSKIPFVVHTKNTITSKEEYIKQLIKVPKNGYAVADRENDENVVTVAAPIYDYKGSVIAAIGVIGLYNKEENLKDLGEKVKETAIFISESLNNLYTDKIEG